MGRPKVRLSSNSLGMMVISNVNNDRVQDENQIKKMIAFAKFNDVELKIRKEL